MMADKFFGYSETTSLPTHISLVVQYAFVVLNMKGEAQRAIQALNEAIIAGRRLVVSIAKPRA